MSTKLNTIQKILCKILVYGKIPKHIAFIMDGNRRYAKNLGKNKIQGHKYGLQSLKKSLLISLNIGVKIVTLFAFAIQNLNRQPQQVNALMELTKTNFKQLSAQKGFFEQKQIKIKVIGNLSLLPQDVRKCLEQIQQITKGYNNLLVNLCFVYNSTYQIQKTAQKVSQKKSQEQVHLKDFINELMIKDFPDIIVRTSNEVRLSDFLTIQSMKSQICFLKQNWPEISVWSFLRIIIPYNLQINSIKQHNELIEKKIDAL